MKWLLLSLLLTSCAESTPQGADNRGVVVAHVAWIHWSIGPWWEPPVDDGKATHND